MMAIYRIPFNFLIFQVLHELDAEILDFYDAPPSAAEVRPRAAKGVCIRHLSEFVLRQFETFLGPPSMGTMYNWEYLAAKMGLTASEIVVCWF